MDHPSEPLNNCYVKYIDCKLPESHCAVSKLMPYVGSKIVVDSQEYKLSVCMDTDSHNQILYHFSKRKT